MKLSEEAEKVLQLSMRQQNIKEFDRTEIERLIGLIPDDRVFLYKNVMSNPIGDLPRYSIHIRVQHLLTFTTFLLLAFTGLPVHFFDAVWAKPFSQLLGGIDVTRVIHRTLAAIMIVGMVYHVITLVLGTTLKLLKGTFDIRRTILPRWKDLKDMREDILYFSGRAQMRPEMDKFMYKQKIHYFAAVFGSCVMVASGSSFLYPDIWASYLPYGWALYMQNIMRLAHSHEALLALVVIAFWHWYNVHLAPGRFPMQWTFLSGKITREHQIEEHFLEYIRNLVELPEERSILLEQLAEMEKYTDGGMGQYRQTPVALTEG